MIKIKIAVTALIGAQLLFGTASSATEAQDKKLAHVVIVSHVDVVPKFTSAARVRKK